MGRKKVKIAKLRIGSHYSYDNDFTKLDRGLLATYLQTIQLYLYQYH
jgi:hypothetical protein